jgi:hypothetical protein
VNTVYFGPDPFIPVPTFSIVDTVRKLKNNSALGEDLINVELNKHGGTELWECIRNLIVDTEL